MNVLHKKINSDFSDSLNVHSFSYIMFVMSTIKYPNAISTINTMQQKSYSSRGMRLENDINDSNKYYRELDKALIYKKPTPVQVVHVDYPKRQRAKITEAYYKTPSTTDYNGVYRGGSLTLAHSQNSQMSFMYGFFFVKFLFFTVVCVVIVV